MRLTLIVFFLTFSLAQATEKRPWEKQPTSIGEISCGRYVVGAKLKISPAGQDTLLLYPETDREFEVPLLKLKGEDSLRMEGVYGFFEVEYPLEKGKKQGYFHFRKLVASASAEKTYHSAIKKINSACLSL